MNTVASTTATSALRRKRIEDNLPLVRYCVSSMHLKNAPSGLEFEDLVGHGTLGLIRPLTVSMTQGR